jgi:hypothetical protein
MGSPVSGKPVEIYVGYILGDVVDKSQIKHLHLTKPRMRIFDIYEFSEILSLFS